MRCRKLLVFKGLDSIKKGVLDMAKKVFLVLKVNHFISSLDIWRHAIINVDKDIFDKLKEE